MPASAFVSSILNLPLLDLREELRAITDNVGNFTTIMYPCQMAAYPLRTTSNMVPANMFPAAVGSGAPPTAVSGTFVRRMPRQIATGGMQSLELRLPLSHNPAALGIPTSASTRRRYVAEWVMWGDAFPAGSILAAGVQTRVGGPIQLPGRAFADPCSYHFSRVSTENGGLWTVQSRQVFGAVALTQVNTTLDSLTPRTFKMEFIEGAAGGVGTLSMQIDGAEIIRFGAANFPAVVPGNVPNWCFQFGSEGVNDAGFDYLYGAKYQVFEL